jgi:hypothetical protein
MQKLTAETAEFAENAEDNMSEISVLEECFLCVLRGSAVNIWTVLAKTRDISA